MIRKFVVKAYSNENGQAESYLDKIRVEEQLVNNYVRSGMFIDVTIESFFYVDESAFRRKAPSFEGRVIWSSWANTLDELPGKVEMVERGGD